MLPATPDSHLTPQQAGAIANQNIWPQWKWVNLHVRHAHTPNHSDTWQHTSPWPPWAEHGFQSSTQHKQRSCTFHSVSRDTARSRTPQPRGLVTLGYQTYFSSLTPLGKHTGSWIMHFNQNSGPKNTPAKLLEQLLWSDLRVNRQISQFFIYDFTCLMLSLWQSLKRIKSSADFSSAKRYTAGYSAGLFDKSIHRWHPLTQVWASVGSLLMHVKYVHYTLLKIPTAASHGQILQTTYSQWVSMIKMSFLWHNPPQSFQP